MHKQKNEVATQQINPGYRGAATDATQLVRQLDKALYVLRIKQLIERTNLSRATLYVLMEKDPTFPKKIQLTARSIGFLETEVDAWIQSRAQLRGAI